MLADRRPGAGATPQEAGLVPEPLETKDLSSEVEALKARIFNDPSQVAAAEFDLSERDGAKLIFAQDTSAGTWSMDLDYRVLKHEDDRRTTASFGVRMDEDGTLTAFAKKTTNVEGQEAVAVEGTEATDTLNVVFDSLLKEPERKSRIPTQNMVNVLHLGVGNYRISEYDSLVDMWGKRMADEYNGRIVAEETAFWRRLREMQPVTQQLLDRNARINILNPNSHINHATIHLPDGVTINQSVGGYNVYGQDSWYTRIEIAGSGSVLASHETISFGLDTHPKDERGVPFDRLNFRGPHIHSYTYGRGEIESIKFEGPDAYPSLDLFLDAYFPQSEQPQTESSLASQQRISQEIASSFGSGTMEIPTPEDANRSQELTIPLIVRMGLGTTFIDQATPQEIEAAGRLRASADIQDQQN